MRQVPGFTSFLIVGGGRMARHLRHYFGLESIPFAHCERGTQTPEEFTEDLKAKLPRSSHVCLAISDRAISSFLDQHPFVLEKSVVHFSGALVDSRIPSAHPLMTFGDSLYDLETYHSIPFILEKERGTLAELLPGLTNASFAIEGDQKALYHAWCVMTGNFTTLLWEEGAKEFEKLGLPRAVLLPYLAQTTWNIASPVKQSQGRSQMTGPLVRGDSETIRKNLEALDDNDFAEIYRAFEKVFERRRLKTPLKESSL